MEGFESVMAYISNTLSFLCLAAFSLNHVALSIAIFTVANMLHTTGYWLTVVLGNVFILVLEAPSSRSRPCVSNITKASRASSAATGGRSGR